MYEGKTTVVGKRVESCTFACVTLSQKMRLALPVCIPASCFFDQQAVHHKNSKGDIWDFRTELEVSTPYLKTKRTGEDGVVANIASQKKVEEACIFRKETK